MKKILAFVLAVACTLSLAGCGGFGSTNKMSEDEAKEALKTAVALSIIAFEGESQSATTAVGIEQAIHNDLAAGVPVSAIAQVAPGSPDFESYPYMVECRGYCNANASYAEEYDGLTPILGLSQALVEKCIGAPYGQLTREDGTVVDFWRCGSNGSDVSAEYPYVDSECNPGLEYAPPAEAIQAEANWLGAPYLVVEFGGKSGLQTMYISSRIFAAELETFLTEGRTLISDDFPVWVDDSGMLHLDEGATAHTDHSGENYAMIWDGTIVCERMLSDGGWYFVDTANTVGQVKIEFTALDKQKNDIGKRTVYWGDGTTVGDVLNANNLTAAELYTGFGADFGWLKSDVNVPDGEVDPAASLSAYVREFGFYASKPDLTVNGVSAYDIDAMVSVLGKPHSIGGSWSMVSADYFDASQGYPQIYEWWLGDDWGFLEVDVVNQTVFIGHPAE